MKEDGIFLYVKHNIFSQTCAIITIVATYVGHRSAFTQPVGLFRR